MNDTPDAAIPVDAEGQLAIDLECIGCHYNLRMCDPDGRCPECGIAVGRSAVGHFLKFRDPDWVECLYRGMNRFAVFIGSLVIYGFLLLLAGLLAFVQDGMQWALAIFAVVIVAIAISFGILGVIRATKPDPSPVEPEGGWSWRRFVRVAGATCLICMLGGIAVSASDAYVDYSPVREMMATVFFTTCWFSLIAVLAGLLMHAGLLMKLVPNIRLAWVSQVLAAIVGLSGLIYIFATTFASKLDDSFRAMTRSIPEVMAFYDIWLWFADVIQTLMDWSQIIFGCTLVVSVVAVVPLFILQWRIMKRETARARATWAATPFVKQD